MATPVTPVLTKSFVKDPSQPSKKKQLLFGGDPHEPISPRPLTKRRIEPTTTPTRPEHIKASTVFKAHVSPGGTTRLPYPSSESGFSVYAMFNRETGATYVGSTSQDPKDRFQDHAFHLSHPENPRSSAPVYQQLSLDPENIRMTVLEHHKSDPDEDLAELERKHIAAIPSPLRLNANKGGGGGLSFKAAQAAAEKAHGSPSTPPKVETTPQKSYPFKKVKGRVVCQLTPSAKRQKGVIYSIEGEEGSYTGFTTRTAHERVQEHARKASKALAKTPLYAALEKNPEAFKLQIHAADIQYPSHLVALEEEIICHKKAKHPVFNQNKGRGGCFRRAKK